MAFGPGYACPEKHEIDGDLSGSKAHLHAHGILHEKLRERAAQFLYMVGREAFMRAADPRHEPANPAPDNQLWEGDAVEWYFEHAQSEDFRQSEMGSGRRALLLDGF